MFHIDIFHCVVGNTEVKPDHGTVSQVTVGRPLVCWTNDVVPYEWREANHFLQKCYKFLLTADYIPQERSNVTLQSAVLNSSFNCDFLFVALKHFFAVICVIESTLEENSVEVVQVKDSLLDADCCLSHYNDGGKKYFCRFENEKLRNICDVMAARWELLTASNITSAIKPVGCVRIVDSWSGGASNVRGKKSKDFCIVDVMDLSANVQRDLMKCSRKALRETMCYMQHFAWNSYIAQRICESWALQKCIGNVRCSTRCRELLVSLMCTSSAYYK